MKPTVKKWSIISVLFILCVSLCGCMPQQPQINLAQQMEEAKAKEQKKIEEVKLTQKDILEKMYRNGLIDEDFSDVKQRLDREYEAKLEQQLKPLVKDPYFVKCDVTYFNTSLKEAKEGNWNIEKILADPKENIYMGHIRIFVFEDRKLFNYKAGDVYRKHNAGIANFSFNYDVVSATGHLEISAYCCDNHALNNYKIEDYVKNKEILSGLRNEIFDYDGYIFDVDMFPFGPAVKSLEKKYGEPFVNMQGYGDLRGQGELTCAPLSNPKLLFQKQFMQDERYVINDKYLTVLAQDYFQQEMDAILQQEGLQGRVAMVVIPHAIKDEITDRTPCQTTQIKNREDRLRFLNTVYHGEYDVNLEYMKAADEEIDILRLQSAIAKAQKLITEKSESGDGEYRVSVFVHVYNLTDEDRATVLKLFKRHPLTEGYFRGYVHPGNVMENLHYTRVETDGFHYLEVFGENTGFTLQVIGKAEAMSSTEFVKRYQKSDN